MTATDETKDSMEVDVNNNDASQQLATTTMVMTKKLDVTEVVIHPLVLLSVADHYHRVARGTRKRVVGVLLGQVVAGGKVDATNSFAVPFEEDSKNTVRHNTQSECWMLDALYRRRFMCRVPVICRLN